jgi:hypothetical protein
LTVSFLKGAINKKINEVILFERIYNINFFKILFLFKVFIYKICRICAVSRQEHPPSNLIVSNMANVGRQGILVSYQWKK